MFLVLYLCDSTIWFEGEDLIDEISFGIVLFDECSIDVVDLENNSRCVVVFGDPNDIAKKMHDLFGNCNVDC